MYCVDRRRLELSQVLGYPIILSLQLNVLCRQTTRARPITSIFDYIIVIAKCTIQTKNTRAQPSTWISDYIILTAKCPV